MILITHPDNVEYLRRELESGPLSAMNSIPVQTWSILPVTRTVVRFPKWPFVEFGPEDESWGRLAGFVAEERVYYLVDDGAIRSRFAL